MGNHISYDSFYYYIYKKKLKKKKQLKLAKIIIKKYINIFWNICIFNNKYIHHVKDMKIWREKIFFFYIWRNLLIMYISLDRNNKNTQNHTLKIVYRVKEEWEIKFYLIYRIVSCLRYLNFLIYIQYKQYYYLDKYAN